MTVSFFPFEADQKPPALQQFIDAMNKRGKAPNENSLSGWINGMQFVQGLQDAGPDFTRPEAHRRDQQGDGLHRRWHPS